MDFLSSISSKYERFLSEDFPVPDALLSVASPLSADTTAVVSLDLFAASRLTLDLSFFRFELIAPALPSSTSEASSCVTVLEFCVTCFEGARWLDLVVFCCLSLTALAAFFPRICSSSSSFFGILRFSPSSASFLGTAAPRPRLVYINYVFYNFRGSRDIRLRRDFKIIVTFSFLSP